MPKLTIAYLLMESSDTYLEINAYMENMSELQNQNVEFTPPTSKRAPWAVLGGQVVDNTITAYKAGETPYVEVRQLEPHYREVVLEYFLDNHNVEKEQVVGMNFMELNKESS